MFLSHLGMHLQLPFLCFACRLDMMTIMKSFRKELLFDIPTRRAFVNITHKVEECLRESGIREGLVLVNAMHITASVFILDDLIF
jgi:hypothetical protein